MSSVEINMTHQNINMVASSSKSINS